jgi:NSS family neurotransmitter:Na+ symporter
MSETPRWSSNLVFLLGAIGAAVGLGNIWKFPYAAGVGGGGAFVLVYLGAVAFVAIPIVAAELMIGRRGRAGPVHSFSKLAVESGGSRAWGVVGWINVTAVFAILTFYSVIAGWAMAYVPKLAAGTLSGASAEQVGQAFDDFLLSPVRIAIWQGVFLAITVVIVCGGLQRGIERAVKLLMPALFLMLLGLVGYGMTTTGFGEAVAFLFDPDFSKLDADVVLGAIGQAFFSASVAMGLTVTYGCYMRRQDGIMKSAVIITLADTIVAMLAGLAIFPLVFANGLDPAGGPGLIFRTLPVAFASMAGGRLVGTIFFLLLVFAALTSSIAILETIISPFIQLRRVRRSIAATVAGVAAWLIGLATVLSFNVWADVRPLGAIPRLAEKGVFDLIDYAATNIMLPLGGVLIAIFAGWRVTRGASRRELGLDDGMYYRLWRLLIRFAVPVLVAAVLFAGL